MAILSRRAEMPLVIPASVVLNLVIIAFSIWASLQIFGYSAEEFNDLSNNLGTDVQRVLGIFTLIPAVAAGYGIYNILRGNGSGRYITLAIYYTGAVLTAGYLLHLWDFFVGFDAVANAVLENSVLLWGFVLAYGVYRVADRFEEGSQTRNYMETGSLVVAGLALAALLLFGGVLDAAVHVIDKYGSLDTWVATILLVIFGYLTWELLRSGEYFGETTDQRVMWQGWMMLSPNIIGFMLFFAGPLLLSLYLSVSNSQVGQIPEFIGLDNYGEILALEFKTADADETSQSVLSQGYVAMTSIGLGDSRLVIGAQDDLFWYSLRNTFLFCLFLIPLSTIPALLLAMVLNSKLPGVNFFRAVYFLPSVAAVVGTALIWRWLYDPTIGYFNYFIGQSVDFLNSLGVGVSDPQMEWLTNSGTVLISIVILSAWQVVGFNTVLFLAGLQGIPKILYEASYVDGANRFQQFRNVTLPMLAPTTFFVIITTLIQGLQVFNEPYALLSARPIPENARTSVFYLYERGFFNFEFGYASSVAWLLFAVIFTITVIQFRLSRSEAYEG